MRKYFCGITFGLWLYYYNYPKYSGFLIPYQTYPKLWTSILPADIVSKIQVYEWQTEDTLIIWRIPGSSCLKHRYLNEFVSGQNVNCSSKYNI